MRLFSSKPASRLGFRRINATIGDNVKRSLRGPIRGPIFVGPRMLKMLVDSEFERDFLKILK
jgi:hypothetical protein